MLGATLLASPWSCASGDAETKGELPGSMTLCEEAEALTGQPVCVHQVPDLATWEAIAREAPAVDQVRTTAWLVPAVEEARLPTLFVDTAGPETEGPSPHLQLMDHLEGFESMTYEEYLELVLDPGKREWFAGNLTEYLDPTGGTRFGVAIWDQGIDPAATITCAEHQEVLAELGAAWGLDPLQAIPANQLQRDVLDVCPEVSWFDPAEALDYEVYTQAEGCGTVRRYTLAELAQAELAASFGWTDLLVIEEAPHDVETVVAGIVTGSRQGELSHLNVRSAARGTPNCYVKNAWSLFGAWQGKSVRLTCGVAGLDVEPIAAAEAVACAEAHKPEPVSVPAPDLGWTEMEALEAVPTQAADERSEATARYGAKAANLAALYQRIPVALGQPGFAIPVGASINFMEAHTWPVFTGGAMEELSFRETVELWLEDPEFLSSGPIRAQRLGLLQLAMEDAPCDPALLEAVGERVEQVIGDATTMVRFRSSSNAEDALDFHGAGLYDSTSVCWADDLDGDAKGPSQCDPLKPKERGVCRGLKRVWASLWNRRAFEERSWFGVDHLEAAMGILVHPRAEDELASIVAFDGNPVSSWDPRYLVNAQPGDLDVVAPPPGMWPEKVLLEVQGGVVVAIERAKGAGALPEGEWVLEDPTLEDLGAALSTISELFPVDADLPPSAELLLDTEWKQRPDGTLLVKQVRPFLK